MTTGEGDAERARGRRRRLRQIALVCVLLAVLLAALLTRGRFSLQAFMGTDSAGDAFALFALTTLNFLAFVVLVLVLLRHLVKLARERRESRLGARFKTRMVVGSIALTLLPTAMLFVFSLFLIRSLDDAFFAPTEQIVASSRTILRDYVDLELETLRATARTIVRSQNLRVRDEAEMGDLERELERAAEINRASEIIFVSPTRTVRVSGPDSDLEPIYRAKVEAAIAALQGGERFHEVAETDDKAAIFMVVAVPLVQHVRDARGIVMVRRFPPALAAEFKTIEDQQRTSQRLLSQQSAISTRYVFTLSLITLLVLFVAIWIALYVSRSVTEPISALAEATDQVSRGNLAHRIVYEADGELGTLIESFNAMASQLGESRARLVEAALELEDSNMALEERRAYIETVLSGLSTGVLSVDAEGRLTTANPAAAELLGLGPGPYEGTDMDALIGPIRRQVEPLFRRARRAGSASREIEVRRADGTEWPAAVSVAALAGPDGAYAGAVVTVEDLSELLKAERAAAWSEVARRMAHEIKNPLTPIQLSAERMARNFKRPEAFDGERYAAVVEECTSTIIREVGALAHMVEEFSRFARLPQARPVAADLNDVVRTAAGLYRDRLHDVELELDLADDLPVLQLDTDQMKRVVVNLIDNAVEAVGSSPERRVTVSTRHDERDESVRLVVEDTGDGVDPALRDRLFLPYFSTRTRGTGLGLAIVSHIVADHKGTIGVSANVPRGARFTIELPVVA